MGYDCRTEHLPCVALKPLKTLVCGSMYFFPRMTCAQLPADSPVHGAAVVCSILGMSISCSCLYHAFLEWEQSPDVSSNENTLTIGAVQRTAAMHGNNERRNSFVSQDAATRSRKGSIGLAPLMPKRAPSAMRQFWKLKFKALSHDMNSNAKLVTLYLRVLLQLSWILFVLDSCANLLHVCAVTWLCPQHNCSSETVFKTDNCISGPMVHSQYFLQPTASALFALATVNRFLTAYAILSKGRYRVLRIASVSILIVTAALLTTQVLHTYHTHARGVEHTSSFILSLHKMAHFLFWASLGVCIISALTVGLHHVLSVRSELDSAMSNQLGILLGSVAQAGALEGGCASAIAAHSNSKKESISTPAPGAMNPSKYYGTIRRYRQTTRVIVCLIANLVMFCVYCAIMVIPTIYEALPATVLVTVLSLAVKIFGVSTTIAIHAMTAFVMSGSSPDLSNKNEKYLPMNA